MVEPGESNQGRFLRYQIKPLHINAVFHQDPCDESIRRILPSKLVKIVILRLVSPFGQQEPDNGSVVINGGAV